MTAALKLLVDKNIPGLPSAWLHMPQLRCREHEMLCGREELHLHRRTLLPQTNPGNGTVQRHNPERRHIRCLLHMENLSTLH